MVKNKQNNKLGKASLVLGIISIVTLILGPFSMLFSIPALILGIIQNRREPNILAKIGKILSIVSLVFLGIFIVINTLIFIVLLLMSL